ncbi:hypothetical protein AgCh_010012 [Apium graveolens]
MIKTLGKEKEGFLVEFNYLAAVTKQTHEVGVKEMSPFLSPVVNQYANVFELPKALPPVRHHNHIIILREGTDPMNAIMNDAFQPYITRFVLIFFDDILIYSSTPEERVEYVNIILEILRQHQLYANKKKYEFVMIEVAYLRRIISQKGVAVDPEKIVENKFNLWSRFVQRVPGVSSPESMGCWRQFWAVLEPLDKLHGSGHGVSAAIRKGEREMMNTFKFNNVSDDAIKLRLFPFSLRDKAKCLLNSLPPGSITKWEDLAQKFLTKFFPMEKTTAVRNALTQFEQ